MLPEIAYKLEFETGVVSVARSMLTDSGEIILTQELPWELSIDSFHLREGRPTLKGGQGLVPPVGVPRLTVNRVVVTHPPWKSKNPESWLGVIRNSRAGWAACIEWSSRHSRQFVRGAV